ncbi:hypothetical protein [Dapis sp. BLCC M229]|uniref:hypothetical protein n=1 Tax=Dapis sp. BLCC M229 TaxID=3400188 RepID=UPI003CF22DC0
MSDYFPSYREKIKSIRQQIAEVRKNLNLINEEISWYPEYQEVPLALKKNQREQEKKLVNLLEQLGRLLETQADLSNVSKSLFMAPYLIDRIQHELAFSQVFERRNNNFDKLLVCLIHGDKQQSQDMFLERLKVNFLPKKFNHSKMTTYHVRFPETLQNFHSQLKYNLANTIVGEERNELTKEINHTLAESPVPVIISTYMYCEHWLKFAGKAINSFLHFWENRLVISPNQHLFVFLFIITNNRQNRRMLDKFRCLFSSSEDSRLDKQLNKLSEGDFSEFNNFYGVVLPKLEGITEQEATEWVDVVVRKHFPNNLAFVKDTKSEIQAIFNQYQSKDKPKRIPLDELARKLSAILVDYAVISNDYTARRELA